MGDVLPFVIASKNSPLTEANVRIVTALHQRESSKSLIDRVKGENNLGGSPPPLDRASPPLHITHSRRFGPFLFIGRDRETGLFYTDYDDGNISAGTDLFALIGVLETLKVELTERAAALAPSIDRLGRVQHPELPHEEAK
ncbi:hypothetical protein [Paracoccus litorisediminis]|uniref:hypothetical protein n=1 Tax=Paracoccus litorisediminis TaxID=2006130 RepID=UPI00147869D3|nr:hypothetical protein [Paracoccus litorisediminis]